MKKVVLGVSALALVFLVSGCGDSPDGVTKDSIKLMNEMADAVESAKDKDSAEKAASKLEDLDKKFKDLAERAKKLKITKDQEKKVQEKYKDEIDKAQKRMEAAGKNLQSNPQALSIVQPALLKIIKSAMEVMQSEGK